ncbi:MAG TPA: transglycosylase SLT domain-containing protein [Burkholderiales bacterium]|nr:transglycosylase SLT domain-containing protein [Burkholderiales bacterium]
MKNVLAAIGFVGLGLLALLPAVLPVERDAVFAWLGPEPAAPAVAVAAGAIGPSIAPARAHEQRTVTEYIARRYRVSEVAVASFVDAAYRAGARYALDPLLVLAVMAVESRYNPVAKSGMGAKGLMQVIPRFHLEKLADHGGETALLEPEVNIFVGAQILREYMNRFRDTETALQMYAGALDDPSSTYTAKVLAEKARLEALRQRSRTQQSV